MIPKINSSHGAETRNIINRVIEVLNQQGKSLQDLVAEGQLTEEQYANLITSINGLVKSGQVDKSDLTPEFKGEIEGFNTQLAQKVGNGKKAELEDLSATVLSAIEGGGGTSFDLLSIPQDKSVTVGKTDFINEGVNKLNLHDKDFVEDKYLPGSGILSELDGYFTSGFIPVKNGDVVRYAYDIGLGKNNMLHLYDIDKQHIGATPRTESTYEYDFREETIDLEGVQYFRLSYKNNMKVSAMVTINTPYPDNFVPYTHQLNESFVFNETQKDQVLDLLEVTNIENPLARKTATFDGDSIAHGGSAADGLSGWAGRIGKRNDMTWENTAVGGGTITAETYKSDGSARHWVSRNIENLRSDADYIILEGGVNDADVLGIEGLGELSNSYDATFDDTTFTGALESTFKKAILRFPSKKIGFIIPHKMGSYGSSVTNNRRAFFDRAIEVCEKWGIPYIDLWKTVYFTPNISEVRNLYYSDSQHLNTLGYDTITPRIESWMRSL